MPYKIEGSSSEQSRIIVLNESDWSVDATTVVSGNYSVEFSVSGTKTILSRSESGETHGYSGVTPTSFEDSPTSFGLQLKTQQYSAGYAANVIWTWDEANSRIQQFMAYGGISIGEMFVSIPKAWLNGKKIKVDWQGSYYYKWDSHITIMDGKYDRTSTSDFPHIASTWFATKGAGELYNTSNIDGSFAREIVDTGVLDLSSSTQDDVTLFIRMNDSHNTYDGNLWVYNIQITDASDNVLTSVETAGAISMVDDGSWDYGTYGNWNAFYS